MPNLQENRLWAEDHDLANSGTAVMTDWPSYEGIDKDRSSIDIFVKIYKKAIDFFHHVENSLGEIQLCQ